MPSLWFCVPVHGRQQLTQICLRQLRRTCDALTQEGIDATAVVVGDDANLDTALDLGFGTVRRDNRFLSRKFNDGIQLACDPKWNPRPATHVVPCGSDDWVDPSLFLVDLPDPNTVLGFQHLSFVREDGQELTSRFLNYPGGAGIRVYPATLMAQVGYRPADEDRKRACDTSILTNISKAVPNLKIVHGRSDARQIVDWKSSDQQLNPYDGLKIHRATSEGDPFRELVGWYPAESLAEMEAHYANVSRTMVAA